MDCTTVRNDLPKWFANCPTDRMRYPEMTSSQLQFDQPRAPTKREQEVLIGVANGMTTKQIATHLGISFKTAECHRVRLMQKLHLHSASALVRYAVRSGLVEA